MKAEPTLMFSAGEASGDLYAAALASAVRKRRPAARVVGMGGSHMASAGVDLLIDIGSSSVVGLSEVVRQIPDFLAKRKRLRHWIRDNRPDTVVLIDFPDFNLPLAESCHEMQIPVVYFIPPKAWAWRPSRAKRIANVATKVISILPFEADFYKDAGAAVEYVGHPLVDLVSASSPMTRDDARIRLGLPVDGPVLGLLPGSRTRELNMLLPTMLAAATSLRAQIPDLRLVLPVARTVRDYVASQVHQLPDLQQVRLIHDDTYNAIRSCDVVIAASGTVTLETALLGVPMVTAYRMSPTTYRILRRLVHVPYTALPNLLADREIVPEFIQNSATPENLASAAFQIFSDAPARNRQREELAAVVELLGPGGAVERAADVVIGVATT